MYDRYHISKKVKYNKKSYKGLPTDKTVRKILWRNHEQIEETTKNLMKSS